MEGQNAGEILRVARCSREGGWKICWVHLVSFLWCFNGQVKWLIWALYTQILSSFGELKSKMSSDGHL